MTDSLSHLPVMPLAQVSRHVFGADRFVSRRDSGLMRDQTERKCVCGLVKITVHGVPADQARMWRLPGSSNQFRAPCAPPCLSGGAS